MTTNEDAMVRVYSASGALLQELPHPGTTWTVAILPNGDLVTCCNQSSELSAVCSVIVQNIAL